MEQTEKLAAVPVVLIFQHYVQPKDTRKYCWIGSEEVLAKIVQDSRKLFLNVVYRTVCTQEKQCNLSRVDF